MSNITDYYNKVCKMYDKRRRVADAYVHKSLMENFTGKSIGDMDILDAGCGTGNYACYFLDHEPRSLTLVDASDGMLSVAREKLQSPNLKTKLSFKTGVLPNIPFEDNSFDSVMMNLVLHHLEINPDGKSYPNIAKTIKEVYRVLKPRGALTVTTLTPEQFEAYWFCHLVPGAMKQYAKKFPYHKQMKDMLTEAGLTLKTALNMLTTDYHPGHDNLEGPLQEDWRNHLLFWDTCSETEIQDMVQRVQKMKEEGTLRDFYNTHEKTHIFGALQILAAQK
ncbi:ubiquinone/menaquinone biosynthesis C-methyltransferase UbiE-like isoform X1 [Saccostrea cucullata]|uniref:ubiquinone/menaquinone biosynthesis C-methyltransferase UbiE-like isoform X1 n=2 Tax=Saccostrea cuccullata TaxID=36930 RepID=UPI002ED35F50